MVGLVVSVFEDLHMFCDNEEINNFMLSFTSIVFKVLLHCSLEESSF